MKIFTSLALVVTSIVVLIIAKTHAPIQLVQDVSTIQDLAEFTQYTVVFTAWTIVFCVSSYLLVIEGLTKALKKGINDNG